MAAPDLAPVAEAATVSLGPEDSGEMGKGAASRLRLTGELTAGDLAAAGGQLVGDAGKLNEAREVDRNEPV